MIVDYKRLGFLIKTLRVKRRLTQEQFSKQIGYTNISLCKVENGRLRMKEEFFESICKALDIDAKVLLVLSIDLPELLPIQKQLRSELEL